VSKYSFHVGKKINFSLLQFILVGQQFAIACITILYLDFFTLSNQRVA